MPADHRRENFLNLEVICCVHVGEIPSFFEVGQRVVYCSDTTLAGVVKFVGTTHFSEGEWVGLALDKPRGKHDGTVLCQH